METIFHVELIRSCPKELHYVITSRTRTLELLGSCSNVECRKVQSWVLSFTCYFQPTFQPYSPNTHHLVTSMLMMRWRSSMVHLLISSHLLAALMLSLKICTSGCLPTGYR